MASNEESVAEPKRVEASTAAAITAKAAGGASSEPVTFQIVRVRNPDGKIVRVKRPMPIGDVNGPPKASRPEPSPEAASPRISSQPNAPTAAASVEGAEATPASNAPKLNQQPKGNKPGEIPKLSSKKPAVKVLHEARPNTKVPESNEITKQSTQKAVAKPVSKDFVQNPAGATSPDNPTRVALGFQRARNFLRHGRGVTQTIAALNPNWDLGDVDEFHEGDEYMDEDDSGEDDDDEDEHDDDDDDEGHDDDESGQDKNSNPIDENDSSSAELQGQSSPGTAKKTGGGSGAPAQHGNHSSAAARNVASNMKTKPKKSAVKVTTQEVPASRRRDVKSDFAEQINEKEMDSDSDVKVAKSQAKYGRILGEFSLGRILVWSITIILPILFIVLGVITATLNGVPNDNVKALVVRQAIKAGVTSWPIVFAAIVAQSLKALATYRVERGMRLMTLEQLINSHSVGSAIKQPFLFRRLDFMGIALLCLWSLSPLASQALQRMSYDIAGYTTTPDNVTYVDTTYYINPAFGMMSHQTSTVSLLTDLDALYSAAFLPPGLYQTPDVDTWGYPKIPVVEDWTNSGGGWYQPPSNINYTSLFGIPIQQFQGAGARVFNVTSAYYKFNCPPLRQSSMNDIAPEGNSSFSKSPSGTLLVRFGQNLTILPDGSLGNQSNSYNLTFASRILSTSDQLDVDLFASTVCTFHQARVVSEMRCLSDEEESFSCTVLKMAPLPVPSDGDQGFLMDFTQSWLDAGSMGNKTRTLTERYLNDPSPRTSNADLSMNLTEVPAEEFTRRLSILFNSYSQIGFAPMFQAGNYTRGSSVNYEYGSATAFVVPASTITSNLTNSTIQVCTTDWAWLSTLLICSVFLLVAGIASAFWEWQSVDPDILSFVSTVIRHSKHIVLPKGSGVTSGAKRAKLLKNVRVIMQNVRPNAKVGKIALGTLREDSQRLEKGKLYN